MSHEHEEKNSIWASRSSPESAPFSSFAPRRARAGTLPSRLPSRIDTSSREPLTSHLGSLALISPDGNDIVYDSFPPCSRTAVGQQPGAHGLSSAASQGNGNVNGFASGNGTEKRRSPPLAPILEPTDSAAAAASLSSSSSSTSSSHLPSGIQGQGLAPPGVQPSAGAAPGGAAALASSANKNGRARSGSLNSLAMLGQQPYVPFGSSIWGPNTRTPAGSSGLGSAASTVPSSVGSEIADPMLLLSNELNKTATPQRIRSYTLDGAAAAAAGSAGGEWARQQQPHGPLQFAQRTRAQTLMPQGFNSTNGLAASLSEQPGPGPLTRFAQQQHHHHPHQHVLTEQTQDLYVTGDYSPSPTPAICISNVPPQATQHTLQTLFGSFGKIESACVIPNRRCAYIVFASTIQAIEAQATANGAELYIGNGPSSVAFTQVMSPSASTDSFPGSAVSASQLHPRANSSIGGAAAGIAVARPILPHPRHVSPEARNQHEPQQQMAQCAVPLPSTASTAPVSVAYILQTLNADRTEISSGIEHLRRASSLTFDAPIKPLADSLAVDPGSGDKTYNAAVLRDLRRRLETMLPKEVEEVALDMQRELPALASDYIGNTAVQLVFERSGPEIRDMMLRRLVDVFAATGTHKNGTWAVQKMIDLARGPRHYALIEKAIRPHLVALLLDQFGNYVVQGCLKFGTPYSDFVYSGIATVLPKIAPNRFGARAVRAVLESEHTTAANQRLVATAIVQQIATLAANPNGCLLVSWLLDNFERSDPDMHLRTHALVAAQLVPQHLATMCSSKLGSGIVLKLAASPSSSSHRVFDALLEPLTDRLPSILVETLEDPSGQGASCIYRLMTTVFPPQSLERQVTVNKVRMCLLRPGARIPNHKRLLEEVGLNMLHPEVKEASASGTVVDDSHQGSPTPPEEVPVIYANANPVTSIPNVEFSAPN